MTSPDNPSGKRIDFTRPRSGQSPAPSQPAVPNQPGPPAAPTPAPAPGRRAGVPWTTYAITIIAFILILIVVVFITQNTTHIPIKFFGTTKYESVASALAGAAAVGFLAGLLIGLVTQIRVRRELRTYRKADRNR
ncbi:MAG: lipopolysaccharide assembly protein LapA domain-containing protein [Frankia sp.]